VYLILLGPPGAGKGTQGALLSTRTGLPRVATGDLLRDAVRAGTPLGREAQGYMDRGLLVPDRVILGLIEEVLDSPGARQGVIMDGFPRTVAQAEAVDEQLRRRGAGVTHVLRITVPDDELVRRLLGRAIAEGRSDDTPETIQKRLGVYRDQTEPLVAHYRDRGLVREIDGVGTVEAIAQRIDEAVRR
jgi:adenylate kinase